MELNCLMIVDVQDLLDGRQLGLIRCAGSLGARAFDELVSRHWKPFYQVLPPDVAAECECSFAPLCECSDVVPYDGFHSYGIDVMGLKRKHPDELNFVAAFEMEALLSVGFPFVEKLTLSGCANVTGLPNQFLEGWRRLEHIEFNEPVSLLKMTPSHFLGMCICLRDIDLTPLSNVTTIQHRFLEGCGFLEEIDFAPMTQIATIGDCFLKGCKSIKCVDLAPLSRVTCVGQWFLAECSSLEKVDLAPISNITAVRYGFMKRCTKLTKLDLKPLLKVETIGAYFLFECKALKKLNLDRLINVTTVGPHFLTGCD